MRPKEPSVEQSTVVLARPDRRARAPEVLEYPSCDGEPMAQNNRQLVAIVGTVETLREHFRNRQNVHVRGDMFIYYSKLRVGSDPHDVSVVPDVFVVVGPKEVPQSSYKVWEVGIVPQFVMEVASHSTHRRDRDEKYEIYERLGFREYWWFDPSGTLLRPEDEGRRLLGWRLGDDRKYGRVPAGSEGLLRSAELDLGLCVVDGELRFWDYEEREFLRNRAELVEAHASADKRAEDAFRQSDAANRRAAAADRRAEVADRRAEVADRRAEVADRRAEAANKRTEAAEREISRLRDLLVRERASRREPS